MRAECRTQGPKELSNDREERLDRKTGRRGRQCPGRVVCIHFAFLYTIILPQFGKNIKREELKMLEIGLFS